MIGNKAVAGSGIAATAFGTSAVEVLYMDEAGNGTFSAEYLNGQWFTRKSFLPQLLSVANQEQHPPSLLPLRQSSCSHHPWPFPTQPHPTISMPFTPARTPRYTNSS